MPDTVDNHGKKNCGLSKSNICDTFITEGKNVFNFNMVYCKKQNKKNALIFRMCATTVAESAPVHLQLVKVRPFSPPLNVFFFFF